VNKQLLGLKRSLKAKIAEVHQENDASLLKLQKYQASVSNFECVVEEQNENILSLQQANDELQKTICTLTEESEQAKAKLQEEVTSAKNNVCILEKQLVEVRRSLQEKVVALHQEKDAALLELLASQASVRNFESVVEERNENISYLQQAHDELQKIICTLTEESEQGKANLLEELKHLTNNNISRLEKQLVEARRSLHAKIAALHEENDATLLDLHASQASVRNFENMVVEQKAKIMSLQQDNDEL
jgi:predicted RNase H-like nuclease (RuvC/YqgF family)